MKTAVRFDWQFPTTLNYAGSTYKLVPQTRRDVRAVDREAYLEMNELVSAAFDGDACLFLNVDFTDWFGWMIVQDLENDRVFAVLVEYSNQDGTFPHQWCRVKKIA